MRYQTSFILIVLFLVTLFAGLNWELFTTPNKLNLLFIDSEAPLGMVMLTIIGGLSILYLAIVSIVETGALLEGRRRSKELDKARKLANIEEESRYKELQNFMKEEIGKLNHRIDLLFEHFGISGDENTSENKTIRKK